MYFAVTAARGRVTWLKVAVLAVVLMLAAPVFAAASPLASLQYVLLLQPQGSIEPALLVQGELPAATPLPAEIVLPIPAGMTAEDIRWAGEILGGDFANDPEVVPQVEVRNGVPVAVLQLSQSRIGKVEMTYQAAVTPADGDLRTVTLDFTTPFSVETLTHGVVVASGFQVDAIPEGVLAEPDSAGNVFYRIERTGVPAGDAATFAIDYRGQATPAGVAPVQAAQGEFPLVLALVVAAVLGAAVLLIVASRSRQASAETEFEPEFEFEPDVVFAEEYDETFDEDAADPVPAPAKASPKPRPASSSASKASPKPRPASSSASKASPKPRPASSSASKAQKAAPAKGGGPFVTPKILLIGVGILVFAIVAITQMTGQGGAVGVTETNGNEISQRINVIADGVTTESVDQTIVIRCQCTPQAEATKIFGAFGTTRGIGVVTLDATELGPLSGGRSYKLTVEYDPAVTNVAAIQAALGERYMP